MPPYVYFLKHNNVSVYNIQFYSPELQWEMHVEEIWNGGNLT